MLGVVRANELSARIAAILGRENRYPADIDPEPGFDGTVLFIDGKKYIVMTKKETGVLQYGEIDRKYFDDPEAAIVYAVGKIFGDEIDGIRITW